MKIHLDYNKAKKLENFKILYKKGTHGIGTKISDYLITSRDGSSIRFIDKKFVCFIELDEEDKVDENYNKIYYKVQEYSVDEDGECVLAIADFKLKENAAQYALYLYEYLQGPQKEHKIIVQPCKKKENLFECETMAPEYIFATVYENQNENKPYILEEINQKEYQFDHRLTKTTGTVSKFLEFESNMTEVLQKMPPGSTLEELSEKILSFTRKVCIKDMKQERLKMKKNCHRCGNENVNFIQCSGCNVVYYCSIKCQKEQWNEHKKTCCYPDEMKVEKKCNQCGNQNIKLLKCSKCHKVYYCNIECQKKKWHQHRIICN